MKDVLEFTNKLVEQKLKEELNILISNHLAKNGKLDIIEVRNEIINYKSKNFKTSRKDIFFMNYINSLN